jgi:hypothetical protein
MERPKPPVRRCAIYTRKSSEEGLEQEPGHASPLCDHSFSRAIQEASSYYRSPL